MREAAPGSFKHCCAVGECPGGLGATCVSTVAFASDGECEVRLVSFESLKLLQLSDALILTAVGGLEGAAAGAQGRGRRGPNIYYLFIFIARVQLLGVYFC